MMAMIFMMVTVVATFSKIIPRIMIVPIMLVLFMMMTSMMAMMMMMMARGSSGRCTLYRRFNNTQFPSFNN